MFYFPLHLDNTSSCTTHRNLSLILSSFAPENLNKLFPNIKEQFVRENLAGCSLDPARNSHAVR